MRAMVPRRDRSDHFSGTIFSLAGVLNGRRIAAKARLGGPDLKVSFINLHPEDSALDHGYLEPAMAVPTKPFPVGTRAARVRGMIAE